nr:type II toxin-antitoxin system RelE/ParE family toxin [Bifidobacterium pseudolongum]
MKHLDGPIWEMRSRFSGNIQRACYFHVRDGCYVITHGFTKKTQRTPNGEIDKAKSIYDLYMRKG